MWSSTWAGGRVMRWVWWCTGSQKQQQQPSNSRLTGTTQLSWYQKGKTNLDLLEQEMWMTAESPGPYANLHPTTQFFTGRITFLMSNQQHQNTEGNCGPGHWRYFCYKTTHTHTIVLLLFWNLSGTTRVVNAWWRQQMLIITRGSACAEIVRKMRCWTHAAEVQHFMLPYLTAFP